MIWAVVLAAGESRRMGTQKLLLPYGGTTVAGAVVRTARESRADRVLVVLGADRAAVRQEIEREAASTVTPRASRGEGSAPGAARDGLGPEGEGPGKRPVAFAINENYRQGMLSSIKTGFRALPQEAKAAVIMLGDQPFIAPGVIDTVIGAYKKEGGAGKSIVIPTSGGRRGHPVLVDMRHRDEVLAIDPADGLRQLMWAHPGDILEVEAGDAAILRDLDTPAEYQERVRSTFFEKK